MKKYGLWNDRSAVEIVIELLQKNQLVVGTSDTVLGLFASCTQKGFNALNRVKKRANKPYLVLVGSWERALQLSDAFNRPDVLSLVHAHWPGPLTVIVKALAHVPSYMLSDKGTIAIRIPAHTGLQHVLQKIPALFSTSANRAGQPVPATIDQMDKPLQQVASYIIVDEKSNQETVPSTLVDCTGSTLVVVRQGSIRI